MRKTNLIAKDKKSKYKKPAVCQVELDHRAAIIHSCAVGGIYMSVTPPGCKNMPVAGSLSYFNCATAVKSQSSPHTHGNISNLNYEQSAANS